MSASSDFYLGADGSYKPFATDKEKQANYSTMGGNGTQGGDGQSTSTGDSHANLVKKQGYEKGMVVCSQKKALLLLLLVFILILIIALIAALARPGCGSEVIEPTKPPVVTKPLIATNGERFPWDNYRLPKHAIPFHYQITIQPDYSTYKTFKGNVIVKLKVTEDTKSLVIHMGNLTVTQSSLSADVGINHPSIKKTLYLRERQQLYIHSEGTMEANKTYLLRLQYTGKLEEGLGGIYVTHYTDPNGSKRYLVVTHFEPSQARGAFPCFDEPKLKAKFKIRIFRPKSLTALSNMPLEKTEDMSYFYENMDRDDFHETELMSTYLVAFVVSDYEYQEAAAGNVKLRVYTPPHQKSQAAFALDTCKKVIEYFTDFFGIPYPLPKLDLVAIPNFAAGAMENWGLITYKDRSILYDPSESDIASHERVAIVVAHELAHQWFGNLVTMEWWNDLWLNEGFASFMEMQGAGHSQPTWSLLEQFNTQKVTKALLLDALHSSHPVSVSVEDPAEIDSLFDDISYKKGASIINMLMNFMGEDNMRKGLKDYLNKYRYKNAKTDDLWASLQNYSSADTSIKEVMSTWTKQMGYPLITIRRSGGSVTASQQRFVVTNASDSGPKSPYNYRWYVPLTCIVENVKNSPPTLHKKLIDVNRVHEKFLVNGMARWMLCNVNQSGFYRVNYDLESWAALRKALNSEINTFTAKDRAGLLDDAFFFTRNRLLDVSVALDLTSYLPYEKKYTPWRVTLTHLATWAEWLFEHAVYKKLNLFRRRLVEAQYDKLGWDDEGSHLDKLLRIAVLATAIDAEMPHAIAEVKKRFDDWMRKNEKIPPNLKSIVYNGGIRYGGQEEWDFMKSKLSETDVASEKKLIMTSLTSTRDPWILNQMLHDTLNASRVRSQDIVLIVSGVASNPVGKLMALRHVEMYWDAYYRVLKNANFLLSDLILKTTAHFSNIFDYKNIKGFFEGRSVGQGARALNQSLEFLYSHANWVNHNAAPLEAWVDNYLANGYDIQA